KQQTGFVFFYDEADIDGLPTVSVSFQQIPLETALQQALKELPLQYNVQGKTIFITKVEKPVIANQNNPNPPAPPPITVKGRITDADGNPIMATITEKGKNNATTSNANGFYELKGVDEKAVLVVTAVNIETTEVRVVSRTTINILVGMKVTELDAPI